jgi:hypothetical protein
MQNNSGAKKVAWTRFIIAGKPLIIYNIDVLNRALKGKVTAVAVPSHLKRAFDLINEHQKYQYQGSK